VTLAVAALLGAPSPPASAQGGPPAGAADSARIAGLNGYVDRLAAFGFSGQIVVSERGHVLVERACGWADRRFAVPMVMETRLGIGSVTKNFVAAAILRLESRGRLRLDDPLGAHLPDVPADKAGITLAQLLSHTGGIARDGDDVSDHAGRDEVVRALLSAPLADPPGRRFRYSNAGFDLLAAVVERVSGASFDEFVRKELLEPAGLASAGIAGSPNLPEGPAARGYNEWKEVSAWTEWPAGWKGTGSGRMVAHARDLWRWAEGARTGKAITAAEWARMSEPRAWQEDSSRYGLGIHVQPLEGGATLLTMGGDVDGYRAEARIYPAGERVIVVLTNQDLFGLGVQRRIIANTLSRLAQGLGPPLPPATRPAATVRSAESPVGLWRLPTGGEVEIREELGQLRLGARGQDVVDLFEPDPGDSTGMRRRVKQDTEALVRAAVRADTALALGVVPRAQFEFAWPFLSRRIAALDALHGGLQSVHGLGVIALPWDPGVLRSYLQLRFLDREVSLFVGWQGSTLYDVTFDEDRPFPVLYPAAALAEGGYAAYDVIRRRETRFRVVTPQGGSPRLVLRGTGGEIVARRVR